MEKYNIPFYQRSSLKWYTNLIFLFSSLGISAMSIMFFSFISEYYNVIEIFLGLFMLILSLFMGYLFISAGLLKKFYIELTLEYFSFKFMFKKLKVNWDEISEVHLYDYKNNTILAILLKKDVKKKKKRTLSNSFNSLIGVPSFSFQIPMTYFSNIDAQRLLFTIEDKMTKENTQDIVDNTDDTDDTRDKPNNLIKALQTAFLSSILLSILYGFSIFILKENIIVIPIFLCLIIISSFNKYYIEKAFNIKVRLITGFLCFIQVPIAILGANIMTNIAEGLSLSLRNIVIIIKGYYYFLMFNPKELIIIIIISIICFLIGIIKGRNNGVKMHKYKKSFIRLSKKIIGLNIFNENLKITGYDFNENTLYELEQYFNNIKDISNQNYYEKSKDLKKFFRKLSKSMGFNLIKPKIVLSIPEEFSINNKGKIREFLYTIILENGWNRVYFVDEIISCAIGCDLPINKTNSEGLYVKNVIILCKKNSVTFGLGLAGGIYEKTFIPLNITSIDQATFDNTIKNITRKGIELPKSLTTTSVAEDKKKKIKDSWETETNKTIYLMASENDKNVFMNNIQGYDFVAPDGYDSFVSKGLEKIIKEIVDNIL